MSLNYGFIETLKLLGNAFHYNIFISIIISFIILTIILYINKDKKIMKYIISIINIILVLLVCYFYLKDILSFKFNNPINNMYFYFLNTIIYLIVLIVKRKYSILDFIFYGISLINILFSIFMTNYLNNINLVVIGNIFPMIKFGNIIYILYYLILLIKLIIKKFNNKKY